MPNAFDQFDTATPAAGGNAFDQFDAHAEPAAPATWPGSPYGAIPGAIPPEVTKKQFEQKQAAEDKAAPALTMQGVIDRLMHGPAGIVGLGADIANTGAGRKVGRAATAALTPGDEARHIIDPLMGLTGAGGLEESLKLAGPAFSQALQLGGSYADAAKAAASALSTAAKSKIPSPMSTIRTALPGSTKAATTALQGEFQGVGSDAAAKAAQAARAAEEESLQTIPAAHGQIRDARVAQTEYADEAARQAEALQKEREGLTRGVGTPGSAETRGTPLQERVGQRLNQAFEARAKEAEDLFTKTVEAGKAKEAAGIPFASSPQGQQALKQLKALKVSSRGTNPLLPQEEQELDRLISMIEGDATKAKAGPLGLGKISGKLVKVEPGEAAKPAGVEALMKQIRLIRKYNETAAPVEGSAAIPKQFMKQINAIFEPALYGKEGWLPEGGAADAAYKLASEKLNAFGTEPVRRVTRGEKFDFRQMAASPDEFADRFFKNGQTVRQLKDATGDANLVRESAKDWAATQMRNKSASAAREWAIKNESALKEAGIGDEVTAHVKALADYEQKAALHESQVASRTKELAQNKQAAKALPGKIEKGVEEAKARQAAVQEKFQTLTTELGRSDPKAVAGKVESMGKALLNEGHIDQAQYDKILGAAADLRKKYVDQAEARKILTTVAKWIGISAAGTAAIGHSGIAHSAEADDEKERKYQAWKRKREQQRADK